MTANPLRAARGTTATLSARVLKDGELAYNTDTDRLHVGDGTTLGGKVIVPENDEGQVETRLDALETTLANQTSPISAAMAPLLDGTINEAMEALDQGAFTATGGTTAINLATRYGRMLTPEDFGAVGDGTTNDSTALQAWLDCGEKFLSCEGGTYGVGTMLTIPPGVQVYAAGATFKPTANVNIMRLHGGAMLHGSPDIDVTGYSGWSSICILIDGSSEQIDANNFRVHSPTFIDVHTIGGTTGTGNGTAVKFNAEDDGVNDSWIMGIHVRLNCLGFDKAVHIVKGGTALGRAFINSNYFEIDATYPLQTIVIESGHASSYGVDRNIFVGASQSRAQADQTEVPLVLAGQYNVYDFMQWDWLGGNSGTVAGITIASGARGNRIATFMDPALITNNSSARNRIFNDYHTLGYDYFGTIVPIKNDSGALGTSSLMWSDLFLASGSVLNFNNGDVTITHASNSISVQGGKLQCLNSVGAATEPLFSSNTTDSASVLAGVFAGERATPGANDAAYMDLRLRDSASNATNAGRILWRLTTVTDGAEEGDLTWGVTTAGAVANKLRMNGTALFPVAAAGLTLGSSSLPFGPLYFRPGTSVTPAANGDLVFEFTNNTTVTVRGKGSDGTVRSGTITLS